MAEERGGVVGGAAQGVQAEQAHSLETLGTIQEKGTLDPRWIKEVLTWGEEDPFQVTKQGNLTEAVSLSLPPALPPHLRPQMTQAWVGGQVSLKKLWAGGFIR